MYSLQEKKIYVAGHRGMVGAAIIRRLSALGCGHIIARTSAELDLTDGAATRAFLAAERPDVVILAAAKVGGILANNTFPADFIYRNLQIQNNIIHNAYLNGVERLLFLGSSCIYPRECRQPIKEEYLLTGPLEPTNEPYAIAKIAGIVACQSYNRQFSTTYLAVMPTNLYGPNDNFDLETSHVLPALINKFHHAKELGAKDVTIWGSGTPRREFLHVDDLSRGCIFLLQLNRQDFAGACRNPQKRAINIGCGTDLTISELATIISRVVGFKGELRYDRSKPDGTPQKLLDITYIRQLGWQPEISLEEGIRDTYEWYLKNGLRLTVDS